MYLTIEGVDKTMRATMVRKEMLPDLWDTIGIVSLPKKQVDWMYTRFVLGNVSDKYMLASPDGTKIDREDFMIRGCPILPMMLWSEVEDKCKVINETNDKIHLYVLTLLLSLPTLIIVLIH